MLLGRRRARAAAAIVTAAAIALTASVAAAAPPPRPTTNVTAFAPPNHKLAPNPVLYVGQSVLVVVTGFAGRATVTVGLVDSPYKGHLLADSHGAARWSYVVQPGPPGSHHVLTF